MKLCDISTTLYPQEICISGVTPIIYRTTKGNIQHEGSYYGWVELLQINAQNYIRNEPSSWLQCQGMSNTARRVLGQILPEGIDDEELSILQERLELNAAPKEVIIAEVQYDGLKAGFDTPMILAYKLLKVIGAKEAIMVVLSENEELREEMRSMDYLDAGDFFMTGLPGLD